MNKTMPTFPSTPPNNAGEEEFQAGIRSLIDLVSPTRVETNKEYHLVERDGKARYLRYLNITGFPRRLRAGWVDQIISLKLPMQCCFHLTPFDSKIIIQQLEGHLTQLKSNQLGAALSNRIRKASEEIGVEDTERIIKGVEAGTIRVFSVSLTIGIHASSYARLEQRTNFLLTHLRQHRLDVQSANLLQDSAWLTVSPMGLDSVRRIVNLDSGSLATCLPYISSQVGTGDGAFLGFSAKGEPVFFHPWSRLKRLSNANIVVCGESGRGKSYLTKKLVTGCLATGEIDAVVIDRDDDYAPLADALKGESQRIFLSRGCPLNPFDLPYTPEDVKEDGRHSDLLADHIDNNIMAFLGMMVADSVLSRDEEAILHAGMLATYEQAGISSDAIKADTNTLLRPAPVFTDLAKSLKDMQVGKKERRYSLIDRLEKCNHFFRGETSISLKHPLTIFSIKDVDEAYYPLVMYCVRNFLQRNRAMLRDERFLLYLIEEASFMLRHPAGRKYLEQSARGVRKLGIAQVTISQHPDDFLEDGKVIVANAGTCFFLGMQGAAIAKLQLTPELEQILGRAKPGEVVLRTGNEYAHFKVVASPEEHAIFTTDPIELAARKKQEKQAKKGQTV